MFPNDDICNIRAARQAAKRIFQRYTQPQQQHQTPTNLTKPSFSNSLLGESQVQTLMKNAYNAININFTPSSEDISSFMEVFGIDKDSKKISLDKMEKMAVKYLCGEDNLISIQGNRDKNENGKKLEKQVNNQNSLNIYFSKENVMKINPEIIQNSNKKRSINSSNNQMQMDTINKTQQKSKINKINVQQQLRKNQRQKHSINHSKTYKLATVAQISTTQNTNHHNRFVKSNPNNFSPQNPVSSTPPHHISHHQQKSYPTHNPPPHFTLILPNNHLPKYLYHNSFINVTRYTLLIFLIILHINLVHYQHINHY